MANHPSYYAALTYDRLVLAPLGWPVEAYGRKPNSNNPTHQPNRPSPTSASAAGV